MKPPRRRAARRPAARARGRAGSTGAAPATIDAYLATVRPDQRAALERLRRIIRAAAPGAEECISYRIPAFRRGRMLVGFGATASHCSFFLMSATTLAAHEDLVRGHDTSAGTIRFQPREPLPAALVRRLVEARIAENEGESGR